MKYKGTSDKEFGEWLYSLTKDIAAWELAVCPFLSLINLDVRGKYMMYGVTNL